MIREAFEYLVDLGLKGSTPNAAPTEEALLVGTTIIEPKVRRAKTLTLHTLAGFVEAIEEEEPNPAELLAIIVFGPNRVELVSHPHGYDRGREVLFEATCSSVLKSALRTGEAYAFAPGEWYPLEEFIIRLLHLFEDSGDRAELLKLLGNIKQEAIRTSEDDGVTQVVTQKGGIQLVEAAAVKNPWQLAPFRTFREVDQPSSPWILRLKQGKEGIVGALFEADGGAWELEAIDHIAMTLRDMTDLPVIG